MTTTTKDSQKEGPSEKAVSPATQTQCFSAMSHLPQNLKSLKFSETQRICVKQNMKLIFIKKMPNKIS